MYRSEQHQVAASGSGPEARPLRPGAVVDGRYQLLRGLGRGGLGSVFHARDRVFDRDVALKALHFDTAETLDIFRREFSLLCACVHPRLARAHDFGRTEHEGQRLTYYTAELIRGTTATEHARGRSLAAALVVLTDALDALAWLHGAGIVHGDFKPDNVLVREDGSGVLIDLSAARRLRAPGSDLSGTGRYLAPELLEGAPSSVRSDLFAVGRTLQDVLALISGPGADAALGRLLDRLTATDPEDRPSSAEEVLEAFGASGARRRTSTIATEPGEILGRGPEIAAFTGALSALMRRQHGPRVVVVSGTAGIGKSRLCRELQWTAQAADVHTVEASPQQHEPLRSLLSRALRRELPAGVDALLAAREELASAAVPRLLVVDGAEQLPGRDRDLLQALLRATAASDALLWVISGADPWPLAGDAVLPLPLGPLDDAAVRTWTAPFVTAARLPELVRVSGGRPRALKGLCAALASGRCSEADLDRFAAASDAAQLTDWQAAAGGAAGRRLLAALALVDRLEASEAVALGLEPATRATIESLERAGAIQLEGTSLRLGDPGRAAALLAALGPQTVRPAARALADRLDEAAATAGEASPSARSERLAERARLWTHAAEHELARRALREHQALFEWAPRAWVRAAEAARAAEPRAETLIAAAAAFEAAGDPHRALSLIARARRARPSAELDAQACYRAARCYEKRGLVQRALCQLDRARSRMPSLAERPSFISLQALCAMRLGRYAEAAREAQAALRQPPADASAAAELAETLGLAQGFLGDAAAALESLARAVELRRTASPRVRVRSLSYHALQAYRAGDLVLAARGFEQALELAERDGLGDLLATSALNLGTAKHQIGDWGAALGNYRRGVRAAVAFAKARTEATLRFNVAKIHADVGHLDRAELELESLRRSGVTSDAREVELAALGLQAEVAAARGKLDEAAAMLERVRADHAARGSKRETCEAALHAAEVALARRDPAAAASCLDQVALLLVDLAAADLALRHSTASAELALARDDGDLAFEHVRRGADLARDVSKLELLAKHEEVSAQVLGRRGASALAERHRRGALEHWERIASTLPSDWVETFWRHPRRAPLRRAVGPEQPPERSARMELVLKLLEVNRRLSSTLDTDEVLRLAMDSAIELTSAERGFVILSARAGTASGKLEVAVARNIDRERIGKSQLKFSHTIAKRVVQSGEPVLTVDALADERFAANASVHGMRLRSIVCVPIRAHGVVLGAVYLDNRFQRGRFAAEDADLLGAFADQIAVALHNGRLMAELRERTRALEEEQRRVAELMRSQADEIERLSHELTRERSRVEARRDFPEIVGRSAPMRSVLALVDRVAESDVPVTVTGESGTGKELIARAIHSAGPRRDGPFVAVNCAALPEALLESELFGHVKGAFTGAVRDHGGLFVAARRGTLFLDEIGEMPVAVQAKLLRALQEREVRPVGSDRSIPVPDVRIVCATNRDLPAEVAAGRFREDLYYRISVIDIHLPPLRDRPEDITPVAQAIVEKLAARQSRAPWRLSHGALRRLVGHAWPGNVRQLENVLARACVMAPGDEIGPADLDLPAPAAATHKSRSRGDYRKLEQERIRAALELSRWNVCEVSRALGIPRTTLYRKLAVYRLLRDERG